MDVLLALLLARLSQLGVFRKTKCLILLESRSKGLHYSDGDAVALDLSSFDLRGWLRR
jgi:hypothetical protein